MFSITSEFLSLSAHITEVPEKIISLNSKIKEFAENNNFYYIDYFSEMADEENAMKAPLTTDNVHLTKEGYAEMERILTQNYQVFFEIKTNNLKYSNTLLICNK